MIDGPLLRSYADERPRLVLPDRHDPNNDATTARTAVWAAERGDVPRGFAGDVPVAVVDPCCGRIPERRPSVRTRHPARLSPRWGLTPFLDALTALRTTRRNG
ncbi:hypothetical protein [Streptomyces sp. NPDC059176]|uniref:hypothetical protein n=1 Tax=unclassified Streptomyces TaxID=2593676 RepID=UPI0036B15885